MADATAAIVVIGGVDVSTFARVGKVRIDDVLNDAPNTAALTLVAAPRRGSANAGAFDSGAFDAGAFLTGVYFPVIEPPAILTGAPIQIYTGTRAPEFQIFGGQIVTREQVHEFDQPRHVRYQIGCIDFTRRLNYRKVTIEYGQQGASAIVLDVIAKFAPAITSVNVQKALPTITGGITFTFEDVSRALSRIAEKIGAYWYVDYVGDLHFFKGSETGKEPDALVLGADFAALKITADLTQVRTRVIVEGDGATVLLTLPAGDALLPVSQTIPFNPAGGRAKVGNTMITYTGTHPGGVKTNTVGVGGSGTGPTPPPNAPTAPAAALASVKGRLGVGPYQYACTFELSDGRRSALGAASNAISVPALALPPVGAVIPTLGTTPIKGPLMPGVTYKYAMSYVVASGADSGIPLESIGVFYPSVVGRAIPAAPLFPSPSQQTAGAAVPYGYVHYCLSFLTAAGETLAGPSYGALASIGAPSSDIFNFNLVNLPTPLDARIAGRRIYRASTETNTAIGATTPKMPWHRLVDIPDNVQATYLDKIPVDQLPVVQLPAGDTSATGEGATLQIQTSPDPRVVKRRIYRKDGAGDFRLIAEIPDNVTTTYQDIVITSGGALPAIGAPPITEGAIDLTNIPIGPAGTSRRRIFRTLAGGDQFRELTALSNNTATTYQDVFADTELGGSPLPAAGLPGTSGTDAPPTPAGSVELQVQKLDFFPMPGWAAVESIMIRYTGYRVAGSAIFLTGIPATGPGSLTADVPVGTVVTTSPALVGVAPVIPVTIGDAVQLIVQIDDAAAQAALAAIEGGDGIIEHYIQDRRLSEAGAVARANADLALFRTIETRVSYTTHDPKTRSGVLVHVALPPPTNCTGDFLIQRVTIDDVSIAKAWYPKRSVEASTTRFSFEDVLNRLLMESA